MVENRSILYCKDGAANKMRKITRRKYKKRKTNIPHKIGRWEKWECVLFLNGLKEYGKGKWKQIAKLIPTRTTIQVKTHAQMVLKRLECGENVYSIIDESSCGKSSKSGKVKDDQSTQSSDSCDDLQMSSPIESRGKKFEIEGVPCCPLDLGAAKILLSLSSETSEISSSSQLYDEDSEEGDITNMNVFNSEVFQV